MSNLGSAATAPVEEAAAPKVKTKAMETEEAEREATTAAVSASSCGGTPKCKKRKKKQQQQQQLEPSPGLPDKVVGDEYRNGCTGGEGASGDAVVSKDPTNEEDPNCLATNVEDSASLPGTSKSKKKKKNKQQHESSPTLLDLGVVVDKFVESKSGKDCAGGDADICMDPANIEDANSPQAANVDDSTLEGTRKRNKKMKTKKQQEQQTSSLVLPDVSAVVVDRVMTDEAGNDCVGGEGTSGDADSIMGSVNGEDPKSPPATNVNGSVVVSLARTPKSKKKKKKKQQQDSSSTLLDLGVVVVDKFVGSKSGNDCTDGDADVCMDPTDRADPNPNCPQATNVDGSALEGTLKQIKSKIKTKKQQDQQTSPLALSDAGAVVVDRVVTNEAVNDCVGGEGASSDANIIMGPTDGENPNCPPATNTDDSVLALEAAPKWKKRKMKRKRRKQELQKSLLASSDVSAVASDKVLADESGNGCTKSEVTGDADASLDSTNGSYPNCTKETDDSMRNNDGRKGMKDCSENCGLLQDNSPEGKRPKKKRKRRDRWNKDSSGSSPITDVIEASKEKIKNIYSPRGSLIRFRKKKLLILDLNGLLADINQDFKNAEFAHAKVRGKLVFKRPYYDDFLRFCFQNFELGVWSSRKKENVNTVVNILMRDLKQYLLFCWDMSHCTVTGCTTVDNKNKPLVLKELKKLWNKEDVNLPWEQGEFSPSNTLLVDDSPYKALCNPPHTAIFPNPYSYLNQRDDYSLGPGGDLRVYLEKLAQADDVQVFVRDNPFGQSAIAESDPHWNFYVQIVNKMENSLA
ncbi:hypothetical protein ACP70R_047069 [Stipagrostis hirtigluma subsp. patula]